jgi:hypothetical protein
MENSRRDIDKGSCSDASARGEFWKTLWQLHVPAALKNFLWKVSNNIIPTKANLHRQKITPDPLCPIDGPHGRPNLKDPLQVPDGPITKSRAKKIKEAMQGLVQSTWAKFANLSSKTPTFKMGLKEEEPTLIHVIQATDGGGIA